jgi:tellurite resistance protein TehA-like permease
MPHAPEPSDVNLPLVVSIVILMVVWVVIFAVVGHKVGKARGWPSELGTAIGFSCGPIGLLMFYALVRLTGIEERWAHQRSKQP